MISTTLTETTAAIAATDRQLAETAARLNELQLAAGAGAGASNDEAEAADKAGAVGQVEDERAALAVSRELLKELLSQIRSEGDNAARRDQDRRVVNHFGSQNEGFQIGVSHGPISGITFGKKS